MVRNSLRVVVLLFVIFFPSHVFAGPEKLMSLPELEKLIDSSPTKTVDAYFMSVKKGSLLERFNITIQGYFKQPGLKIFLFTSSHQIAAGMSGSPVYVNGKLAGAVSYSLNQFSKEHWGGITPISLMIEQADTGSNKLETPRSFVFRGMKFGPIDAGYETIPGLDFLGSNKLVTTVRSEQTVVTGLRHKKPVLRAGMPIVVDLAEWADEKGEITSLSAMGTITYIDGKGRIFAFGHPFLDVKNVVYSFGVAEVLNTVPSEVNSFKLAGKRSEVLGTITMDSDYGISGDVSLKDLSRLHHFSLEFKREGKPLHQFNIRISDSVMTPIIAQSVFAQIGNEYGAPLSQESSVTQIESRVDLVGHGSVNWKGLFASSSTKFGASTLRSSSYGVATETFLTGIYDILFDNNYDLEISDTAVSVNFIPGRNRVYSLGAYKFPNKVIYGQNPVLDIMLVDENNLNPIAKKAVVVIDWSKVEKPVYTKDTIETEKVPEKIIWGLLQMNGVESFMGFMSSTERQKLLPDYFLGPEDFLEKFSRRLEINNQKVFIRVQLRERSGNLDEAIASAKDIMPNGISTQDPGWFVIKDGLKERKATIRNEGIVSFQVDLPTLPDGYVLERNFQETFRFEVILDK